LISSGAVNKKNPDNKGNLLPISEAILKAKVTN